MKIKGRLIKVLSLVLIILLVFSSVMLFARAGGAGGSSSSGGNGYSGGDSDGGLIFYIIYLIFRMIPFPFNIIVILLLVIGLRIYIKKQSRDSSAFQDYPATPEVMSQGNSINLERLGKNFNQDEFIKKVNHAFMEIQKGWSEQKLSGVRRFISDGIHQRFETQFTMMKVLEQKNPLSDIEIHKIWIKQVEVEGNYQTIHCGINASITDKFISPQFPQLNSGGRERFTEYWTFIRKAEASGGDLYQSVKCPGCGAPLSDENADVVTCPYCGNLLNSGNYDWVLSEITQSDDWAAAKKGLRKIVQLKNKVKGMVSQEDFSIQLLEDKASNAYFQIKTAMTLGDLTKMARFVTPELYQHLSEKAEQQHFAYSRLYLNHVTLIAADSDGSRDKLFVALKSSYQRVELKENRKPRLLDSYMATHQEVLVMERDCNTGRPKGSLYGDRCPACGMPMQNSADTHCPSCGELYNSGRHDWVISGLLSMAEYQQQQSGASVSLNIADLDSLYNVKDYVLNNLMYIIGADGVFAREEKELANHICKKLGYASDVVQPLFDQAAAGTLVIRMPEAAAQRQRIYKLMEKAANSDNILSDQEAEILSNIRQNYQIQL